MIVRSVTVVDDFSMVAGTQLVYELSIVTQYNVYTPCHTRVHLMTADMFNQKNARQCQALLISAVGSEAARFTAASWLLASHYSREGEVWYGMV